MVAAFFNCTMGWKTVVIGAECIVSLTLNRMKITIGNDYQSIPLNDLNTVIISHDKTVITIPLLAKLVENNINVIICNSKNDPIGIFQPFNNHSLVFKQLNKQINWKITRKKKVWKYIVQQKIQSEIDVIQLLNIQDENKIMLEKYKDCVYNDDQTNREAVCARIYFAILFGKEFTRDEHSAVNHALNYGYKILASYISKCIASRGMLTQLGIHHIGESNPFNLTYDFIEPFRAVVDAWVFLYIRDSFTVEHKKTLINITMAKVYMDGKWLRLCNAIEKMIDAYIAFLSDETEQLPQLDFKQGIKLYGEE